MSKPRNGESAKGLGGKNFHGTKLHATRVSLGDVVEIKGDEERREELQLAHELMMQEMHRKAEAKAERIVNDAIQQANDLVEHGSKKAEELIEEGLAQQESITKKAYDEGYQAGFDKGYADATNKVSTETVELIQGAQTLAQGAFAVEQQVLSNFKPQAAQLVNAIVCKIVGDAIEQSPDLILTMVDRAVESNYMSGKVKVVLSHHTLDRLKAYTEKTGTAMAQMDRYELVGDPQLDLDQFYVLGQEGQFNLTPAQQAKALIDPIQDNLPVESSAPQELGENVPDEINTPEKEGSEKEGPEKEKPEKEEEV